MSGVGGPPYVIPGDVLIVNTNVLQTNQIGDDVAAPVDVLSIFCNTAIGSALNNRSLTVNGAFVLNGPLTVNKGATDTITFNNRTTAHTALTGFVDNLTRGVAAAGFQRAAEINVLSAGQLTLNTDALGALVLDITGSGAGDVAPGGGATLPNLRGLHIRSTGAAAGAAVKGGLIIGEAGEAGGAWNPGVGFATDNANDIGASVANAIGANRMRARTIYAGTSFEAAGAATLAATALTWTGVGTITAVGVSTWSNGAFALTITGGPASIYEALNGALTVRTRQVAGADGGLLTLRASDGVAAVGFGNGGAISIRAGDGSAFAGEARNGGGITLRAGDASALVGAGTGGDFTFNAGAGANGGAGGGFGFTGGVASAGAAVAGGGLTFTGGAASATAGSTGGAVSLTTGPGSAAGGAGNASILTGAPNAGTRGTITIGDANVGTITIGATTSASAVSIEANLASTWRVTGATLLLTTTGAFGLTITAGGASTWSTGAGLLTITGTGGLTATSGGATDITLNPGGARNQVNVSGKGIFNARFEATQLHHSDDFAGAALDTARWGTTLVGGSVTIATAGASVLGGAAIINSPSDVTSAVLHQGTNYAHAKSLSTIYEVRLSLSAITQVRVSVLLHNNGAVPNIAGASATDGAGYGVGDWVGFEYVAGVGAGTWRVRYSTGGAPAVDADSTVAPAAAIFQTLRIEMTPAGDTTFYIDGVLRGTVASGSITATQLEIREFIDSNVENNGRFITLDYNKTWQTRT